ncbi:MAG: 16S rRNA (guanine(527)-N(7))-methyltransferase RsmG [Proteobacteria bacterium]|nr:16S rRNA (guanine(527)-N(7))-methyltransferase RsmG [Pseudomonadota bacterium]
MPNPLPLPTPSASQSEMLSRYATLLRQWNSKINLVAPATVSQLQQRHIDDSAQLVPHIPQAPQRVLDVGSGAGLPGLILAILAPQHSYTLVERDQRKAAFLQTVAHQLGLTHVKVLNDDIKNVKNQYDTITCRAWAELSAILSLTSPLLAPGGQWLLLKGKAFDVELKACETLFHLTTERWPSIVPGEGWVVQVRPI